MIKIYNIVWDTDGENLDLPTEMEIPNAFFNCDEDDVIEYISDYITEEIGFCHLGFEFEF